MGFSPTTKRYLLSASGNECAFPTCQNKIFDLETMSFIGEISHIKGNKKGSARYDPKQSEQDRQSFYNGIVMCGNHGTTIDKSLDLANYTVKVLTQWKEDHETKIAEQRDRSWISPPNSISSGALVFPHGRLVIKYWIDKKGNYQIYSEEKLKIVNALKEFQSVLSDWNTTISALKSNEDVTAGSIMQQQYARRFADIDNVTALLFQMMLETPNITFGEFIQFLAPGQDLTQAIKEAIERRNSRTYSFWKVN